YGRTYRFRDRALADAASAGRFTHVGITLELGVEPDWLSAAFPEDIEWRREWGKFGYGRPMAQAYSETNDGRYLRAWERLVRSWIQQVPVDHDISYVTARRIQNWIQTWGRFTEAREFDGFSEGFAAQLFASLVSQAAHVR